MILHTYKVGRYSLSSYTFQKISQNKTYLSSYRDASVLFVRPFKSPKWVWFEPDDNNAVLLTHQKKFLCFLKIDFFFHEYTGHPQSTYTI